MKTTINEPNPEDSKEGKNLRKAINIMVTFNRLRNLKNKCLKEMNST